MINESTILSRTLYGIGIYSHIIRERWPEAIAMKVVGDDCGICRNPLTENGARTLHIWAEKLHPEQRLSDKIARHHDESGIIPDGTCFDFAERYYGLSGQELLDHLNRELHLHLEPEWNPYGGLLRGSIEKVLTEGPKFSFFSAPIKNVIPKMDMTIRKAYEYLVSERAREATMRLLAISDHDQAGAFKGANFDYATFSGTFSRRGISHLIHHSGLMALDFDHVPDLENLFNRLLLDEYLDTALLFRSPSGDGIKWIISFDPTRFSHARYFCGVSSYIRQTYGILIDQSGSDVSRACFLGFDPNAYVNPIYR